jgi:hypothetical protein
VFFQIVFVFPALTSCGLFNDTVIAVIAWNKRMMIVNESERMWKEAVVA